MTQPPIGQPLTIDTGNLGFPPAINSRFKDLQAVGVGANGMVFAATDSTTKKRIAIKKISFVEQHSCTRALREVKIICGLKHENVIQVLEILGPEGLPLNNHHHSSGHCLYFLQELLDTDLNRLIVSRKLTLDHVNFFMYQLIRGIKYIHSSNIIHRDLKPSNCLIDCETLSLKVTDFGLSRVVDPAYNHQGHMTESVGSCWYKSPEQVLTPKDYTKSIDMWAIGCILAEMLASKPLFAGTNELDQIRLILDGIYLEEEDWNQVLKVMPNKLLKNHTFKPRYPLRCRLQGIPNQVLSLLEQLLVFDPEERASAEEALQHTYFDGYRCPQNEPQSNNPFGIEHEVGRLSPTTLKTMIFEEAATLQTTIDTTEEVPSPPLSYVTPEEAHTLEEILGVEEEMENGFFGEMGTTRNSTPSPGSIEDLNRKNLKNSQENINKVLPVQNILNIPPISECGVKKKEEKKKCSDEDEKEEAEISDQKLEEDRELELLCQQVLHVDLSKAINAEPSTDIADAITDVPNYNKVYIEDIENYKEGSDKEGSVQEKHSESNTDTTSGYHFDDYYLLSDGESSDENYKEKHVMEKEAGANSKRTKKRKSVRQRQSIDLDELYRLPTEHLRRDYDYSNERLKSRQKNLHSMKVQQLLKIRDEYDKINKRLRGDEFLPPIDGAVGGTEDDPYDPLMELHPQGQGDSSQLYGAMRVSPITVFNQRISSESENTQLQVSGNRGQIHQSGDGFSSPEELPSSPRPQQTGARPKRSPRKQKAL